MASLSIDKQKAAQHQNLPDHVVAVGASAGGLEAIQELARHLVLPGHFAYIVAQHLAPDHPSLLVDLVARVTSLKVVTAVDGAALEPGVIVIAPPHRDVALEAGLLRVSDPLPRFGPSPCIDLLFESLAEQWGDKGIAVVLSGTGSDGARGLRAVRVAGGLTIAQSPQEAKFDGMPRAAISLGGADLVLEAAAIGERLCDMIRKGGDWISEPLPEPQTVLLNSVTTKLKQISGIDFSQYKESTLRRQVQRRMAIRGINSMSDYLPLLNTQEEESQALVQNLLVGVTSFFRDAKAFEALRELLHNKFTASMSSAQLRVWVAGCASGEEAYSIAMLVSEVLGHPAGLASQLKIFATDLDEQSLAIARRGLYPLSAAKAIPDDLRSRFLTETDGEVEVDKALRNCIVFARHNLCEDPPFPNLDLISCRNTLIYLTPSLQERVLDLFSFALRPGGLLFLGSSEAIGNRIPGFAAANGGQRLYLRTQQARKPQPLTTLMPPQSLPQPIGAAGRITALRPSVPEQHVALLEVLVRQLSMPGLVLDQNHDLVQVIGDVSAYCRMPEGRMTASAAAFLRSELQAEARVLFLLVRADRIAASSRPIHLDDLDNPIRLVASPLEVGERNLTLLSFQKEATSIGSPPPSTGEGSERDAAFGKEIERLELELLSSQDSLHRSLSELEQANEELEASSEELQASAEELQASNEELEASNEELQATNEELATLNQQLRTRNDQTEELNNDLENIQASLSQGMVILDRNLRVTRFSPLAVRVFGLVSSDIGQPLIGVPTTVPLPELRETLLAVLEDGTRHSSEASSEEVSYLVQFMPYQERDGKRLGVIISMTDVSELVALRRAAEAALSEFTCLTIALEVAVWKKDPSLQKLLFMSERIRGISGWTPAEVCQQPNLLEEAILPADRALVQAARKLEQGAWSVPYRLHSRDGREHWVQESAKVLQEGCDHVVVGTLTDITALHALEEQARELAATLESIVHTSLIAVASLDAELRVVMANERFCALVGFNPQVIQGMPAAAFAPGPQDKGPEGRSWPADHLSAAVRSVLDGVEPVVRRSLAIRSQDGNIQALETEIRPVGPHAGKARVLLIVQERGEGSS